MEIWSCSRTVITESVCFQSKPIPANRKYEVTWHDSQEVVMALEMGAPSWSYFELKPWVQVMSGYIFQLTQFLHVFPQLNVARGKKKTKPTLKILLIYLTLNSWSWTLSSSSVLSSMHTAFLAPPFLLKLVYTLFSLWKHLNLFLLWWPNSHFAEKSKALTGDRPVPDSLCTHM